MKENCLSLAVRERLTVILAPLFIYVVTPLETAMLIAVIIAIILFIILIIVIICEGDFTGPVALVLIALIVDCAIIGGLWIFHANLGI